MMNKLFWAQMRCWSLCALVLALWASVGIAGLCSPFLLGNSIKIGSTAALPIFWLPLLFAAVVVWNCYQLWLNRLEVNAHGIDHWTRNGYAFEADEAHPDSFSSELASLCSTFALARPRWFVSVRKALTIKVYTPLSRPASSGMGTGIGVGSSGRAAILVTSGMLEANFSVKGRRTLLAHELAHVRLRSQLFDLLCAVVNVIAWSGIAIAAVFVHAYLGWHLLLLLILLPAICWFASTFGDMVKAQISRIHEAGADRIADIVVGPGAIASCLLHLLRAQLSRVAPGEKALFERVRRPGLLGLWAYIKGELFAEHPHELARIVRSRKSR